MKTKHITKYITICAIILTSLISCSGDDDNNEDNNNTNTIISSDFAVTIDENPDQGVSIGTVEATVTQGSVSFTIVSQSPEGAISINETTGEISVANQTLFDFEANSTIEATVQISAERAENITIVVTITLNDVNEIQMPTEGLVAYYTLNNESVDQSGLQNDGQIVKAIGTTDRQNMENGALLFNGIDSKVVTTQNIDNTLSNGVTFSAWIYFTGDDVARILSNYNGEGAAGNCNERIGFVFGVTPERELDLFYAIDGDDFVGRSSDQNTIPLNEWVHVLGTWDGTFESSGFKLYINGIQTDTQNKESGNVNCGDYLESQNPFHLGMGFCATGECAPFDGKIDDVSIYERVLNASEIESLSQEE